MAAPGSHPSYQDLPLGAVSNGQRAELRDQQFPHHSRLLLSSPCPNPGACGEEGDQCAGSLNWYVAAPWAKERGLNDFHLRL